MSMMLTPTVPSGVPVILSLTPVMARPAICDERLYVVAAVAVAVAVLLYSSICSGTLWW